MDNSVALEGFGGGGGAPLNFRVLNGENEPGSKKENDIWVKTNQKITSWYLGAEEPNVYNLALHRESDWHTVAAPHKLSAGEILNFTIPKSVPHTFEALSIVDALGRVYYIRDGDGTAPASWEAGLKVGVVISNNVHPIGAYSGNGSAYIYGWGSYYHKEGTAWITTGTSSPVAFNALKKNGITVYPISAKLFSGGMWWDLEAKSWQNGVWVDWVTTKYIIENGVLKENLIGDGTLTQKTGYVEFRSSATTAHIRYVSADVTHYKTVCIKLDGIKSWKGGQTPYIGFSTTVPSYSSSAATVAQYVRAADLSGGGTVKLDVADTTGTVYIWITVSGGSNIDGQGYMKIVDFYLD